MRLDELSLEIKEKLSKARTCGDLAMRIESTKRLITILRDSPETIYAFDEELFNKIVDHISIKENAVSFHLINGLKVTERVKGKSNGK